MFTACKLLLRRGQPHIWVGRLRQGHGEECRFQCHEGFFPTWHLCFTHLPTSDGWSKERDRAPYRLYKALPVVCTSM